MADPEKQPEQQKAAPSKHIGALTSGRRSRCKKRIMWGKLEFSFALFENWCLLKRSWEDQTHFSHPENGSAVQLYSAPFRVCQVLNFLNAESFLSDLLEDLSSLTYKEQKDDLYHFHHSQGLHTSSNLNIIQMRLFLYQELRDWMTMITGLPLLETMDVKCCRFEHTDFLLCNNGKRDSRKIGFILYLCRNWQQSDGGDLSFFDTDEFGRPNKVVQSFTPVWNSLIFFEVSDVSYHQVKEVQTQDRSLISVCGWFHVEQEGPESPVTQSPMYLQPVPAINSELKLEDWVNPQYLQLQYQESIFKMLEMKSAVGIPHFLLPRKLLELELALAKPQLPWAFVGPANHRHYEVLGRVPVPGESAVVWEFLQLMQSDLMFDLLFKFSGLDFAVDSEDTGERDSVTPARGHVELQRWTPGCYTTLQGMQVPEAMLETIFFIGYKEHSEEAGGSILFLDHTTGTPLANREKTDNGFAIVYRDVETDCFTKYLNSKQKTPYFIMRGSYVEKPDCL